MDSPWEGSRSLSPPVASGTIQEESNQSVRNESVRKERRGSFEKKYQPDLYLYPSASKLDKINNKREEELKLATTLLGGLADRVLSEQQSLPSSPEKRTQDNPRQVSGDAKDIEEVCGPERKKIHKAKEAYDSESLLRSGITNPIFSVTLFFRTKTILHPAMLYR